MLARLLHWRRRDQAKQTRPDPSTGDRVEHSLRRIPRHCSLEAFTETSSSLKGVSLRTLAPSETIHVGTANGHYRIFLLNPESGRAMIQDDGRLFANPVEVKVSGSTFGGSMIKAGWIGVGLHLEISAYGQRIITPVVLTLLIGREMTSSFAA
jgi:hypothetical protein